MNLKVWQTLHEPRVVTFLMVVTYLVGVLCGVLMISLAVNKFDDWIYDSMAFIAGVVLIVSGITGAPSSWTGRHWFERAPALGIAAGGGFAALTLLASYHTYGEVGQGIISAVFGTMCGILLVGLGITRFERCRIAPYAEGMGPKLPEARKEIAIHRMDEDWKAATHHVEE